MTSREGHYIIFILAMNHNLNLITNKQYTNAQKKKKNTRNFLLKREKGKGLCSSKMLVMREKNWICCKLKEPKAT